MVSIQGNLKARNYLEKFAQIERAAANQVVERLTPEQVDSLLNAPIDQLPSLARQLATEPAQPQQPPQTQATQGGVASVEEQAASAEKPRQQQAAQQQTLDAGGPQTPPAA